MTLYRYRCRGGYPLHLLQAYAPLPKISRASQPRRPLGRQFVDGPQYRDVPLWNRPKARALDLLLGAGDELIIGLGEFSGCATDIVAYHRETARVLRDWHSRGVRVHLTEMPLELDDPLATIATLEAFGDMEEVWAREAAAGDG